MALDHYIPQVYLKNFSFSKPPKILNAIRKRDLFAFTPRTKDVCRIENGGSNSYLKEPRAIESFLKGIEPRYNNALNKLRSDYLDNDIVYVIAGLVAYMSTCSPGAMRLNSVPMEETLKSVVRGMESGGLFSHIPYPMDGKSITDLMAEGLIDLKVDPKYPQAIGISSIFSMLFTLGNFDWNIMHNPFSADTPFITSDYPIAITEGYDNIVLDKVIPLSIDLALRISPNVNIIPKKIRSNFNQLRFRKSFLSREEVLEVNQLVVRCAETEVYFARTHDWITQLVKANARFRIETTVENFRFGSGMLQKASLSVVERDSI